MGQFSAEKPVLPGSALSGNQQNWRIEASVISGGRVARERPAVRHKATSPPRERQPFIPPA